ncbi:hypothetical protein Slala04_54950 [Streptomyces lavendulae subsp. lavendulae]|nr:hypothetical protein Slala04_54950 [Streptomyces lavendulae subsp. lavendulae]
MYRVPDPPRDRHPAGGAVRCPTGCDLVGSLLEGTYKASPWPCAKTGS